MSLDSILDSFAENLHLQRPPRTYPRHPSSNRHQILTVRLLRPLGRSLPALLQQLPGNPPWPFLPGLPPRHHRPCAHQYHLTLAAPHLA